MDAGTNHLGFRCVMTQPMWDAPQKDMALKGRPRGPEFDAY